MRGLVLVAMLAACRGGFDAIQTEPESELALTVPERTFGNDDLVLWYELDEITNKTVLDISGREHHGICRTICPNIIDGYVEEAADFSGSTLIDAATGKLDTFTVSLWLWIPPTGLQCVFRERPISTTAPVRICAGPNEVRFQTGTHTLQATLAVPTSTWIHVAVIWDGVAKSIYVDGHLVGTVEAAGTFLSEQFSVGAFLGHVDDFRIYSKALSLDEIRALNVDLI